MRRERKDAPEWSRLPRKVIIGLRAPSEAARLTKLGIILLLPRTPVLPSTKSI